MPAGKHFQRFSLGWRIGHLLFAIATMFLVLTGIPIMFSGSAWVPAVSEALGGPQVLGFIHRVAATIFIENLWNMRACCGQLVAAGVSRCGVR